MPSEADDAPLDAELAAADAERGRRLEDAKDFARRLNAACKSFEDAYAELRRVDTQLRERRIDWHFVLAMLNAKVKEANSEVRLHEPDRYADPMELTLRNAFIRMVRSADQPKRLHEAVSIIKGRTDDEQNIIRNLALDARRNLWHVTKTRFSSGDERAITKRRSSSKDQETSRRNG